MATNSQIPFIPQGETYVIPAAAAAPAGVQAICAAAHTDDVVAAYQAAIAAAGV